MGGIFVKNVHAFFLLKKLVGFDAFLLIPFLFCISVVDHAHCQCGDLGGTVRCCSLRGPAVCWPYQSIRACDWPPVSAKTANKRVPLAYAAKNYNT